MYSNELLSLPVLGCGEAMCLFHRRLLLPKGCPLFTQRRDSRTSGPPFIYASHAWDCGQAVTAVVQLVYAVFLSLTWEPTSLQVSLPIPRV